MTYSIQSIQVGLPKTVDYKGKEVTTSIFKETVTGPVKLMKTGVEGDQQADLINHGGVDKAVCVYPLDHYSYWGDKLGGSLGPAAFGENLTVIALTEEQAHIGDTFRVGEALVQVSQPRMPCFKLNVKHGVTKFPLWIQETGWSGFYLRVLEEGNVRVGDTFSLVDRVEGHPTVLEVNQLYYPKDINKEQLRRMSQLPELADAWKKAFSKKLANA
ncbi:MOSC domain-containing protein [Halalkalibacterium halodurans]|uniref:MOSC domain-containing protein n=1 Tax=Halalkalibacterium halodurans TaxID=86665 RepID=UPI002E1FE12E|nr:MOSC domain-containing protein [Halalkalibacterium halodurans]